MRHKWKVYLSVVPGEPIEREIACEECGEILTDENEENDNCGADEE